MDDLGKFLTGIVIMAVLLLGSGLPGRAMEGPDEATLDSLAQYYEPVHFNHAMHLDVASSCATCHHHTTGTPPEDPNCARCHKDSGEADTVACQDCHASKRFEAEYLKKIDEDPTIHHVDKVGLKAAYHLRCMGCHQEVGAPTGCQDCHARTEAGDQLFHAGKFAPPEGKASAGAHHGE